MHVPRHRRRRPDAPENGRDYSNRARDPPRPAARTDRSTSPARCGRFQLIHYTPYTSGPLGRGLDKLAEPGHVRGVVAATDNVRVDVALVFHAAVDYDKRVDDQAPALNIRKADGDGAAPAWKSTSASGAPTILHEVISRQ